MMTTTTTIISQTVLFLTRQKYPLKYSYVQCSFQVLPSYLVAEISTKNIWTPQIFNLRAKNKIITAEKKNWYYSCPKLLFMSVECGPSPVHILEFIGFLKVTCGTHIFLKHYHLFVLFSFSIISSHAFYF